MTTLKQTHEVQQQYQKISHMIADRPQPMLGDTDTLITAFRKQQQAQAEVGGIVFRMPVGNLTFLKAEVEKINKRAAKLGVTPVTLTEEAGEDITITSGKNKGDVIQFIYVALSKSQVKLAGWSFVATLEHDTDDNGDLDVIIRRLPTLEGEVDLSAYRDATPENCDHCHTRRRRKNTFIVKHDDGTMKQVGSDCIRDFLGYGNAMQMAEWAERLRSLVELFEGSEDDDEREYFGPREERRVSTEFFLTHVACMMRQFGWTSRGKARQDGSYATADTAESNMEAERRNERTKQGVPQWTTPEDQDAEMAQKAIEWVRALTEEQIQPTERSDYLYNLYTVVKKSSIRYKQTGIAASAISAMQRAEQREIERQTANEGRVDEFVGVEKERRIFKFTVERVFYYEGDYGYGGAYYKHILRDESGATLVWNGSKELEQGKSYEGKYTIKGHSEHERFGKQTYITRPHGLKEVE